MVKTLQVRFVKTAMIAITVLLLVVIGAISGIYTYRTYTDVTQLADMLLENRGVPDMGDMGMMNPGGPGRGSGSVAADDFDWDDPDDMDDDDDIGWFRRDRRITPDHAMSARYFLVLFAEDGSV